VLADGKIQLIVIGFSGISDNMLLINYNLFH